MKANLSPNWKNHLRLIWAITAKDIRDAIRNKNVITILASSLFIILMYRGLPLLHKTDTPTVRIFDAGESALVAFLENSPAVEVRTYASQEKMTEALGHSDMPDLGLVIPADFDQALENGQARSLQGYVVNWASSSEAAELRQFYETEISRLLGQPIRIEMAGNIVYLTPESGGLGVTAGMAISFALIMIGLILIPHLMIEEKKAHTMETLLISPASSFDVVSAKALTGLFYCLVGGAVGLAVFSPLVVHWWLALLAILLGALFAISLGLLLGTLVEDRAQLTMWSWVFILPMFLPLIVSLLEELMPDWLVTAARWQPVTVVFNLQRASFAYAFSWSTVLLGSVWVLALTALVLGVVAWVVRRQADDSLSIDMLFRRLRHAPLSDLAPAGPTAAAALGNHPSVSIARTTAVPSVRETGVTLKSEQPGRSTGRQIIAAIIAKDLRDAIRNKTLVSIILGVCLMAGSSLMLPMLLGMLGTPALVVYDPGNSTILRGLAAEETFRLRLADSPEEMRNLVSTAGEVALGLALPADIDDHSGFTEPIVIEAYAAHWAKPEKVAEMAAFFEQQFNQGAWSNVHVQVSDQLLYPPPKPEGYLVTVISTIAVVLMVIGIVMVPLLIIEEKESHTMDALLTSPARIYQVMLGKALTGIIYCLVASLTFLLLVNHLIAQWGLALLAILLGALLAVSLGILIGLLNNSPAGVSMWGGMLLLLLLGTNLLEYFDITGWPIWIQRVLNAFPGVPIMRLLGLATSNQWLPDLFWPSIFTLLGYSAVIYLLNFWILRRSDR